MNRPVTDYREELITNRRKFHRISEIGWLEMQTTIEIIKELKSYGYEVAYGKSIHQTRMGLPTPQQLKNHAATVDTANCDFDVSPILEGYTGCIVELDTGRKGPALGFRVDIDALPLHEADDENHLPNKEGFRSRDQKTMHACGHDGHTALGLAFCHYLMEHKDQLQGKIRVIFQPAEEGVRGGRSLTEAGCAENLDYMIGAHLGMNVPKGYIGVGTEGFLATQKYDITLRGVPAHAGANPQDGRNALLGAAALALQLHTLTQTSRGAARLNVGTLHAGSGRNVIAQDAKLELEIRGSDNHILEDLQNKLARALEGTTLAWELTSHMEQVGGAPTFITQNPQWIKEMDTALQQRGFQTVQHPSIGGSEDISYMFSRVEETGGKSIHFILGTTLSAPHHNHCFDYDESALILGLELFTTLLDLLGATTDSSTENSL